MSPLHVHIISSDFKSDFLKTKKHWNSFTTDYFLELKCLIEHLKSLRTPDDYFKTDKFNLKQPERLESFLKFDLKCHICHSKLKNMPELKKHLNTH